MKRKQFPQFAGRTNIYTQEVWGSHVCMENYGTQSFEDIQKATETQGHLVTERLRQQLPQFLTTFQFLLKLLHGMVNSWILIYPFHFYIHLEEIVWFIQNLKDTEFYSCRSDGIFHIIYFFQFKIFHLVLLFWLFLCNLDLMNSSLQFLLQGNFSRQSSSFTNPNSDFCYISSARSLCSRWLSLIWMRKCLQTESQNHSRTYFMLYTQLKNCSVAPFIQIKGIIL